MKTGAKAALLLAGAATLAASVPVQARDYRRGHDGIDAGDIIAGALIIGGIAAIASAASSGNDRYYGRSYRDRHYGGGYDGYDRDYGYSRNGYSSRTAVEQCVNAATREARRYGWARVTDVTRINRVRGGYEVSGRLVVEDRGYRGRGGWDRGYHYDRYNDGYDKGRFSCVTRYGSIQDVDLSGLRGSRYSY